MITDQGMFSYYVMLSLTFSDSLSTFERSVTVISDPLLPLPNKFEIPPDKIGHVSSKDRKIR